MSMTRNKQLSIHDIISGKRCRSVVGKFQKPREVDAMRKHLGTAFAKLKTRYPARTLRIHGDATKALEIINEWRNEKGMSLILFTVSLSYLSEPDPSALVKRFSGDKATMIAIIHLANGTTKILYHLHGGWLPDELAMVTASADY